ncbi:GGDEF domain-containing protein [Ureibacillus acetophenoni]|uniref:Diguanylate cyclase (GGDEF)-like protein n=1 Tax=Ureibacillus acetophenoni TaxID=614649 RepID=A0A285UA62_9BACL|nr:diguanylate cyclase [Ureibacillus acetophenoni]SOC37456.1 diguanylate cyclase (GGDEF)-like protein [Ureibacillus acetophenoni]
MGDFFEQKSLTELEILKHNIQKISLISKVTTIIIVFLLVIMAFLSNQSLSTIFGNKSFQIISYTILVIFNLFVYFITDIKKIRITEKNGRKVDFFISFYVVALTFLGSIITISDFGYYNQLMIYTLTLCITCSVIVLRLKQLIISLLFSSLTLLIGLIMQHNDTELLRQQVLYLLSLIPITFFISRSFYYSFHRSLSFQSELIKEAHITRDLTKKLREANRKLELQANLDPLTNLFNRRAFDSYISELEKKSKYESFLFTAIMVDVDCFKLYNDTYGHSEGDFVLANIGRQLYDLAYKYGCFASRWGGEEFTILLINHTEEKAKEICEEIISKVNELKIDHSSSLIDPYVTVSVGASTAYIQYPSEIKSCIHKADEALYFVKENGRNYYEHRQFVNI